MAGYLNQIDVVAVTVVVVALSGVEQMSAQDEKKVLGLCEGEREKREHV